MTDVWGLENNFQELVLTFHHMGPGDGTQVSGSAASEYLSTFPVRPLASIETCLICVPEES